MSTRDPSWAGHEELPGFYIRRLQQIAVAVFLDETADAAITPVQYAALNAVRRRPGIDQRTLAGSIGLDPATVGDVLVRLERRGLLRRSVSPTDRRLRQLHLADEGVRLLDRIRPRVLAAQRRILAPLAGDERDAFVATLRRLVDANNELSRAPRLDHGDP